MPTRPRAILLGWLGALLILPLVSAAKVDKDNPNTRLYARPAGTVPTSPESPPSPPGTPSVFAAPREVVAGYTRIGFNQLAAFPFKSPPLQPAGAVAPALTEEVMAQIPAEIRKLDGEKVVITGFVLPTKIKDGLATEFLLLNTQLMCCFGVTPSTNAWVSVTCPKGIPTTQDVPLPICGKLRVHDTWESGWLASIYQLESDGILMPRKKS